MLGASAEGTCWGLPLRAHAGGSAEYPLAFIDASAIRRPIESPREETLKTLHAAATDIQACETVEEACERTIAAAEDVFEFEMCSTILQDGDWLEPVAMSKGAPDAGARRVRVDHGLAGKTFQSKESAVIPEITEDDESDPAKSFYRSGMSVPIGGVGVFQAVSREPDAFDDADVEFTELLVAHTARTIDRIRYEAELQERGETLERQNERLEEFVNVVSHDLRNPLTVASGQPDLARESCESDYLDAVASEHARMEALIEDLLTLARDGRPVEELETVDIETVATDSWGHVHSPDASLQTTSMLSIRANPRRLRQLFETLFRNAIDNGGDAVTITVGPLENETGFSVADDGQGIPSAERDTVFDRGYSSREENTGFGLAIVREIADAHGWNVTVADAAAGGARFEITSVSPEADDD